jgi:biopolymer transport protein ExbD
MQFAKLDAAGCKPDLTPVVGVALLVALFLLAAIGFSRQGQDESIRLPRSELARPPAARLQSSITLQLTPRGTVLVGGVEVPPEGLRPRLEQLRNASGLPGRSSAPPTVILRADRHAPTGKVQEIIEMAEKLGFEKFLLRAREEQGGGKGGSP